MNKNQKYMAFLESLKTPETAAVIEATQTAFKLIVESEDISFNDVGHFYRNRAELDTSGEYDDGEEITEFDRELSSIANNAPESHGKIRPLESMTNDNPVADVYTHEEDASDVAMHSDNMSKIRAARSLWDKFASLGDSPEDMNNKRRILAKQEELEKGSSRFRPELTDGMF